MLQINETMVMDSVKESYSKKYLRLFNKFKKDNPELENDFKEIAESISVNIMDIEQLSKDKTVELLKLPVAYYDYNEEISEITDKLISRVKESLDSTVKEKTRKSLFEKINGIVYKSKDYKTTDKDLERFERIKVVVDSMEAELESMKMYLTIQTSDEKIGKEKLPRTYGVIRFKNSLVLFSMNSIDVIGKGKPSQKSKVDGTFVLTEILQGESVVKGWNKMLTDLGKHLELKTAKEKAVFKKFVSEIEAVIDLRTKVA